MAETGSAPLINPVAGPERVVGGGSVAFMVPELQRAVRAMKLSFGDGSAGKKFPREIFFPHAGAALFSHSNRRLTEAEKSDEKRSGSFL